MPALKPANPAQDLGGQLAAAALILEGDGANVKSLFQNAGTPADYRSGLIAARKIADTFLTKHGSREYRATKSDRIVLAETIVELTHAIVFSMRHGLPHEAVLEAAATRLRSSVECFVPKSMSLILDSAIERRSGSTTGPAIVR